MRFTPSAIILLAGLGLSLPSAAQDAPASPPAAPPSTYDEVQALIERMQGQIEKMNRASQERDDALRFLEQQIDAATGRISGERETADALRQKTEELSTETEVLAETREELSAELQRVTEERDLLLASLRAQIDELTGLLTEERRQGAILRRESETLTAERDLMQGERERLAAEMDEIERARATDRAELARLSADIEALGRVRAELEQEILALADARNASAERLVRLEAELTTARDRSRELQARLATAEERTALAQAEAGRRAEQVAALEAARADDDARVAGLTADIEALEAVRADLERQILTLADARSAGTDRLAALEAELSAARDQRLELEARLSTAEERTALAQASLGASEGRIEDLARLLGEQSKALSEAESEIGRLIEQRNALVGQMLSMEAELAVAQGSGELHLAMVADLTRRLNEALADKAKYEELASYRSDFFARLRDVLGDRQDVRIVGDRFVFQSELLFPSGQARLDPSGQASLRQLASSLKDVAATIPDDINWILRVDGHTDRVPIATAAFASNWQLSTARAISVVEFLVREGVPPQRLAATGFGEFQPLDARDDEFAYRRNRRIEFKLTEG
jgi:chemotaxis protein MotB